MICSIYFVTLAHSAQRTAHSAQRTAHSAQRTAHSAQRTAHSLSDNSTQKRDSAIIAQSIFYALFQRKTFSNFFQGFKPVLLLLLAALALLACDPPSSSPTYTTTVSGKIITPKGNPITTAQVRANGAKAKTKADGSYELKVKHSGTFQIFVDYTPTDIKKRGDYKQGAPQTVKTTSPNRGPLNIPLNYGYTVAMSGRVATGLVFRDGVKITIEVEGVVIEDKTTTTKDGGYYSINFSHNGTYKLTLSFAGYKNRIISPARSTRKILNRNNFALDPL